MTTQFDILFTLSISHSYYRTQAADFDFVIPRDTLRLFQNRKLIHKVRDGRLYLLSESDEAGAALIPATGQTIRIGLKLINPHFGNFTELDFTPGTIRLYKNSSTPNALDSPQKVTIVGNLLSHTLTDVTRPVTATMFQSASQLLGSETVTTDNDRLSVTFDLTHQASGSYFVEETYPADVKTLTAYYRDPDLLQQGVLGVVEIVVDSSFYASAPEFNVPFAARQETLKYYLVTHKYSNTDLSQLEVSDQGFTEEGRPEITFTKVAAVDFTSAEAPVTLFGNSNIKVVLFKSQAAVARREKARRKIQLNRNGTVLIQHLPQPGADQTTADMIIHVSKP